MQGCCAHLVGSDVALRFAFFHAAVASPSLSSLGLLPPRFFFPTSTGAHIRPYSTNPPSISPQYSTLPSSLGVRVWSYSVPWCTSSAEFALLLLFLVPPSPCSSASFPSSPRAVVRVHATTRWVFATTRSVFIVSLRYGVGCCVRCFRVVR